MDIHVDKLIASLSEVQMKTIATVVGGLLEEALKDHVESLQLENGHRSTIPSK